MGGGGGGVLTNEGDICPRRLKVDVPFCLLDDGPIIGEGMGVGGGGGSFPLEVNFILR